MDYVAAAVSIYPDLKSINVACFNFTEDEARKRKLWEDPRPMPTKIEIEAIANELEKEKQSNAYKEERRKRLPLVGDQMDVIWKQLDKWRTEGQDLIPEADNMLDEILKIKVDFPKSQS